MRRLVLLPLTITAVFTLAAPAPAATPTERRLLRDVKVLKAQVKTLQKQVRDARNIALGPSFSTSAIASGPASVARYSGPCRA